jgi:hypothetical protein
MNKALTALALVGIALGLATALSVAVPATASAKGPVKRTATMQKSFAKHDAWDRVSDYVSSEYDDEADWTMKVKRRSRTVVDVKVTVDLWTDWSNCQSPGDPAIPNDQCADGESLRSYSDLDRETFVLRYRSYRSWGNPYRVATFFRGDRWASIDPQDPRFGGTAIKTRTIRTVDNGFQL